MTRISLALITIALVSVMACGGSDKKNDGGILGSSNTSSSSDGGDPKDPAAFSRQVVVTLFNVFGGSQDPQKMLDLYLPECRTGVKPGDITQGLSLIKGLFPNIAKLKVEDVDLGNPKVEKNGAETKITITDQSKIRLKIDGKFVSGVDFMKSIGFKDPADSPLEITSDPLTLKELDGRLYISDCSGLKDFAQASSRNSSSTPTPTRGNATATATPTRTASTAATATPQTNAIGRPTSTPGRTATSTTGNLAAATPNRSSTPTTSTTATAAIVKTTPTAAQRYPEALQKEFMDDCTGVGAATSFCRCMLDILQARFNVDAYREFERAINRDERQNELNAIVAAC